MTLPYVYVACCDATKALGLPRSQGIQPRLLGCHTSSQGIQTVNLPGLPPNPPGAATPAPRASTGPPRGRPYSSQGIHAAPRGFRLCSQGCHQLLGHPDLTPEGFHTAPRAFTRLPEAPDSASRVYHQLLGHPDLTPGGCHTAPRAFTRLPGHSRGSQGLQTLLPEFATNS
jgi:hypothetical protein